jgi:hypothetical protein
MNDPEFDRLIAEAVAAPFSGWDLSWLEGRRVEVEDRETSWDYEERARKQVRSAASLTSFFLASPISPHVATRRVQSVRSLRSSLLTTPRESSQAALALFGTGRR